MSRLKNPRFFLVYPLVIGMFLMARTTEASFRLGILLISLGETLRLWANGYIGHMKTRRVISAGPYRRIRNPLYLGSSLIGLGICAVVGSLWFALVAMGVLFVVYRRQMLSEERGLRQELGEEYERYRRSVPRYGFAWRPYPYPQGEWSWQGIAASKEWKTVIWVTVVMIGLYLREELWQEREPLFTARLPWKHLALATAAILLMATDGLIELRRHWKPRGQAPGA